MEATSRLCTASVDELESLLLDEDEEIPEHIQREDASEISVSDLEEQLSAFEEGTREALPILPVAVPSLVFAPVTLLPWGLHRSKTRVAALLSDASRILAIALAAMRLQIPIRWFDPEVASHNQPSLPLSVVNAREVTAIRRARLTLKGVVKLTTVNRHSLVLYSPRDDEAPEVLFCADSAFGNLPTPPADRGMIVTAPHHGAADKENVAVYHKLDNACGTHQPASWLWVRSDRDCEARPCAEYLQRQTRYCTRCRGQTLKQPFQSVVFVANSGTWRSESRACNCSLPGSHAQRRSPSQPT